MKIAGENVRSWIMPGLDASRLALKRRCRGSGGDALQVGTAGTGPLKTQPCS